MQQHFHFILSDMKVSETLNKLIYKYPFTSQQLPFGLKVKILLPNIILIFGKA